jgi:hypothetical protein
VVDTSAASAQTARPGFIERSRGGRAGERAGRPPRSARPAARAGREERRRAGGVHGPGCL